MNALIKSIDIQRNTASFVINILALGFVYFIPTLSHLTGIPFYLFEPIRIMVILALLHTNKTNAYLLALTLPVFSFAISSHPVFIKSLIITIEMLVNVFIFFSLKNKIKQTFFVVILSVIISKLIYYALKWLMISFLLIDGELISTALPIQLITLFALGLYALAIGILNIKRKETKYK